MKIFLYRIIITVFCVLLITPTLACKKNSGGEDGAVKPLRDTTVKIAFRADAGEPADYTVIENAINKKLQDDDKPYDIKFVFLPQNNYITKIEEMSKNEGLDAAFTYVDELPNLIDRKSLMNVKAILDARGQNLLRESPDYSWKQVSNKDGSKIFALPRHVPLSGYQDTVAVRGDWMQVTGMDSIDTISDYFEYCSKITEQEGIGHGKDIMGNDIDFFYASAAEHNNTFMLRELAPSYFFPIKDYALRPIYIDIAEGMATGSYNVKNFYAPRTDGSDTPFIRWSKSARALVEAGYAPAGGPGAIPNQDNVFNSNKLGTLWNVVMKQSERIDVFKEKANRVNNDAPEPSIYDVFLKAENTKYIMVGADNLMSVLSNSKNANEAIDFFDWIKSNQANYDLVCYGIEGTHYYASSKTITKDGKNYDIKYISYKKEGHQSIPLNRRYADKMPYWAITDIDMNRWSTNLTDEYILSRINWDNPDAGGNSVVVSPLVGFNIDYSVTALKNAKMNVMATVGFAAEFATGKAYLDEKAAASALSKYEQLIQNLNNANIATLISEMQKQINDYLS